MRKGENPAGYVYVLTHPAWVKIGIVKIGMTARNPTLRAAEITAKSGLIASCKVAWCYEVADRPAVENAVKAMLRRQRVRGRRELFRTDVATAVAAIRSSSTAVTPLVVPVRIERPQADWRPPQRRRKASWRLMPLFIVLTALAALMLW